MTDWRGDPLEILLRREAKTCKGCRHMEIVWQTLRCLKHKRMTHRCKHYEEGNP